MTLTILVADLVAARKLLTRIHFERLKLPVLSHVLATVDAAGLALAVTDLDHWLETRLPTVIEPFAHGRFLIPADALKAAVRGDKRARAHFAFATTAEGTTLTLTVPCGGLNTVSIHHSHGVPGGSNHPGNPPAAIIAWLRSIAGDRLSVRLSWENPGQLTLTREHPESNSATIRVPVAVAGTPPLTAFEPLFLASALECTGRLAGAGYPRSASRMARAERGQIGPVLRFIDHMSPLLASGPDGVFCVLMPMRCHAASIPAPVAVPQPQPQPETPAAQAVAA